jgi:hypothetical protein
MPLSRVDSSGLATSVGVNVPSPNYALHVLDSSGASGTLSLSGQTVNATGGPSYIIMGNTDSAGTSGPNVITAANRTLYFGVGSSFTAAGGGTVTQLMNLDSSGNINMTGSPANSNSYIQMPFIYNNDNTNKWNFTAHNWKHLGFYNLRDGNQYLDIKTNNAYNSLMYMFHVVGYLYNQGEVISYTSGYSYTAPSTILNQYTHNLGNQSISTYRTASPSGGGYLCLKINRGTTGYSEGQLNVYFHSHDTSAQNAITVTSWAQNNNSGNYYG